MHYIFSDDTPDTDPITAAALQVLDPASGYSSPTTGRSDGIGNVNDGNAKERYVLLDMDATGTNVLSAKSMSPDWAITSTEICPAPTLDDRRGEGAKDGGDEGGLMLRIEGMEVPVPVEGLGDRKGDERRLEELVEIYERRMVELRRVVDAGAGAELMNQD